MGVFGSWKALNGQKGNDWINSTVLEKIGLESQLLSAYYRVD